MTSTSFAPSDHPRATDGKFSQKTGAAAEISLGESPAEPASKAGDFARAENPKELYDTFVGLTSPENLYMDGMVSQQDAERRYARYAAGYATRSAELADDNNYDEAVSQSIAVMQGAGRRTDIGNGTSVQYANSAGRGSSAAMFRGGTPSIEAGGTETVLVYGTKGGVLTVPEGSDPTIIIDKSARIRVNVESGASARIVSASPHTELTGETSNASFVGKSAS